MTALELRIRRVATTWKIKNRSHSIDIASYRSDKLSYIESDQFAGATPSGLIFKGPSVAVMLWFLAVPNEAEDDQA